MFNVPFKMREPTGFIIPKGPNLRWARTVRSEIDGTRIQFKAPKHRPWQSHYSSISPKRSYDAKETLLYRDQYGDTDAECGLPDHWRNADFFHRSWTFNGPYFTGRMTHLDLNFQIVKIVNYRKDISLFHPRALEQVIGDNLTHHFSRHIDTTRGGIQEFNAPVNWQALQHLPMNAVRLEVVPQEGIAHRTEEHIVFFPLADDLMARIRFRPSRMRNLPSAELDKRVSAQPMVDLIDNIINSIQITLSPAAVAQRDAALAGMDDTALIQNYPPIKWDTLGEEEKLKILSTPSTF